MSEKLKGMYGLLRERHEVLMDMYGLLRDISELFRDRTEKLPE
ncbi:hypothetical protein ACYULU_06975 [Breznakiellaceae bacterium SP9]